MRKKIRFFAFSLLGLVLVVAASFGLYVAYTKTHNPTEIFVPTSAFPKTLELAAALKAANLPLESLPLETNGAISASISGSTVVFSKAKSLKTQIKALQLVSGSLKMDDKRPREIDLRFDKVVIRY